MNKYRIPVSFTLEVSADSISEATELIRENIHIIINRNIELSNINDVPNWKLDCKSDNLLIGLFSGMLSNKLTV